jgi:NitT/TauT family transport system ATP-binding protein
MIWSLLRGYVLAIAQHPHIVVAGLSHVYSAGSQRLTALADLDLRIERGSFVSIIGPSGAGKTTLLKIIGGLIDPTEGSVQVDRMSPAAAQKSKTFGYVFQDPSLLPWRTVAQNVSLPLQLNRAAGQRVAELVDRTVEAVGLADFGGYYPHQLSGGMRQRVALARAIVMDPDILLLDEPLGSLDEMTRTEMRYEILRLWEGSNKTAVLVTHSIPEAVMTSDVVAVMSPAPGRIVEWITIDLPRPRDAMLERSNRFLRYVGDLRDALSAGAARGHTPLRATA